ncbi:MAG: hypothetical protein V1817_04680 [Candidatus Micrarchaeota archaeon]
MKNKSLQEIEDFYVENGYADEKLRQVLMKDLEYQTLLKEKKRKRAKQLGITSTEEKKYVLSTDADIEILRECRRLEKLRLTKEERFLIKLVKSQLEIDWRKALRKTLDRLSRKHVKR